MIYNIISPGDTGLITRKGERRTNERYASIQKFFKGTVREPERTGKSNQRKELRKSRRIDCKDD